MENDESYKEQVKELTHFMEQLEANPGVPKNVKRLISEAKAKLNDESEPDLDIRVSTAVYLLEEAGEDINMPMHARTQIWTILSGLERLKHG